MARQRGLPGINGSAGFWPREKIRFLEEIGFLCKWKGPTLIKLKYLIESRQAFLTTKIFPLMLTTRMVSPGVIIPPSTMAS